MGSAHHDNQFLTCFAHFLLFPAGGTLLCCETCPASFHAECLGIDPPESAFYCQDCALGKRPLYGSIIWVKLGSYRSVERQCCCQAAVPCQVIDIDSFAQCDCHPRAGTERADTQVLTSWPQSHCLQALYVYHLTKLEKDSEVQQPGSNTGVSTLSV